QHLGPGRKEAPVHLLIGLDRHAEFELLNRHLALFCRTAIIRPPTARPSAALQAGVAAAVGEAAIDGQIRRICVGLTTIEARAAFAAHERPTIIRPPAKMSEIGRSWRGGRAVECAGLENRLAREGHGSSNLPLSVSYRNSAVNSRFLSTLDPSAEHRFSPFFA